MFKLVFLCLNSNKFWWCIDIVWETLYGHGMIFDMFVCVCVSARGEVLGS